MERCAFIQNQKPHAEQYNSLYRVTCNAAIAISYTKMRLIWSLAELAIYTFCRRLAILNLQLPKVCNYDKQS